MSGDLDIECREQLVRYLVERGAIATDESPRCEPLVGGVSNRTVLVERDDGESWVVKQALEKLRVDVDWFSSPERIHREAAGLRWLARHLPQGAVPALVSEDRQQHVIVMQAIARPHESWKSMLLRGDVDSLHVESFARLLAMIHHASFRGRDELEEEFADREFFESLRLEPYFGYAAERVPEATEFLQAVIADTRSRRETLVHGDYSPKNVLVREGRLVLLDHEVMHLGDPSFDLGFSMTHLLSKAHHVSQRRDAFLEATSLYWTTYRDGLGDGELLDGLEPRAVRQTLACLLARVAGRSPLEYLSAGERSRQQLAVLANVSDPPVTVDDLVDRFSQQL